MSNLKVWSWQNPNQCCTTPCETKPNCEVDPEATCCSQDSCPSDLQFGNGGCHHSCNCGGKVSWLSEMPKYPANSVILDMTVHDQCSGFASIDSLSALPYNLCFNYKDGDMSLNATHVDVNAGYVGHCDSWDPVSTQNPAGYGLTGVKVNFGSCKIVGVCLRFHYVKDPTSSSNLPIFKMFGVFPQSEVNGNNTQTLGTSRDCNGKIATYYPEYMTGNPTPSQIWFITDMKLAFTTDDNFGSYYNGLHRIIAMKMIGWDCTKCQSWQTCDQGECKDKGCGSACGVGYVCQKGVCVKETTPPPPPPPPSTQWYPPLWTVDGIKKWKDSNPMLFWTYVGILSLILVIIIKWILS